MWADRDKPLNRLIKIGGDGIEVGIEVTSGRGMGRTLPRPNRRRVLYPQSFSVNNTGKPSQLVCTHQMRVPRTTPMVQSVKECMAV
jgi:hypothetical protein